MNISRLLALIVTILWCAPLWAGQPVTSVRFAHLNSNCSDSAPVTFGQTFRVGDVPADHSVRVQSENGGLPTQMDIKARNPDGSVRHAVLTVAVPCSVKRDDSLQIAQTTDQKNVSTGPASPDAILESDFDTSIRLNSSGRQWHLDARELLERVVRAGGCKKASIYCRRWLRGPIANEWVVGAPPVDKKGKKHPNLMVFFAIRAYGPAPIQTVRVDTAVENAWAYASNPTNETYSVTLSAPGQKTQHIDKLTHYRQARWHRVLWWGDQAGPGWFAALNGRYLQATPAVPSYQTVTLAPEVLAKARLSCAPMSHCDVMKRMEATGAQPQIGPLPRWSSAYVTNTNDYRAYRWMLANSDALGSYSTHFRSRDTGEPLSVSDHPCATLIRPADAKRCAVAPHADDRLPHCHGDCKTPLQAEPAHHGAPAYVAYLVTGDWYYEQELAFWADWTVFHQNPNYRGYRAGLVKDQQVRAQAWDLRTLGFAAYLLPDDSPFKTYFQHVVENNIRWYNERYSDNPDANPLGFLTNGYAVIYPSSGSHHDTGVSPWQLSFFAWATGNLADLGFDGAGRMRDYFSRFQLGLLTSSGFCPEMASAYYVRVRDTPDSDYYSSFSKVYDKTFSEFGSVGCEPKKLAHALRQSSRYDDYDYPPGTMVGYPKSDTGFVANFQIGLAAAVGSGREGASQAWSWFMKRPVRPEYRSSPQFAIVPSVDPSGARQ